MLLIHELGHFLTGYLLKWKIDKIKFYPYGGASSFKEEINRPLKEELWILLMGPMTQIVFYLLMKQLPFPTSILNELSTYHYSILLFNLLPIYPLDGGKLVQILFSYHFPYKKSFDMTVRLSFVLLFLFFFCLLPKYYFFNLLCLFMLLLTKLLEENKKGEYYYQKFLLERYLNDYSFSKLKIIKSQQEMMRDKKHLFKMNGHYYPEKTILKKKYANFQTKCRFIKKY